MLDEIAAALRTVDPAARKRLVKCVPVLQCALQSWDGVMPPSGLVLACSTPNHGVVLRAPDGWPVFDPVAQATIDRADAAFALVSAIESEPSTDMVDLVISATVVLLGARGIAAHSEDVERIVQDGRRPLTILMIDKHGRNIAMVATTVALAAATLH